MPIELLQLCPMMPSLEASLEAKFHVHRWFELPDQAAWLQQHGGTIRAVVTGGHLGIDNDLMRALPQLGIVAINGVGYDKVDLNIARAQGVRVTTTPDVLTDDVADLAIGLMITLLRGIVPSHGHVMAGHWGERADPPLARKASGRKYGVVGLGRIGQAVATRLQGFGGQIGYTDLAAKSVPYHYYPTIPALAAASDVLIVTMAAGPGTQKLINAEALAALGPQGVLINVARGSVVDEPALATALATGQIAGAALDVFADEPRVPAELRALSNVVLTPHIASATSDTREAMAALVIANLNAFAAGEALPTPVA